MKFEIRYYRCWADGALLNRWIARAIVNDVVLDSVGFSKEEARKGIIYRVRDKYKREVFQDSEEVEI